MSLSGLEFPEYLVLRRVGLRAASKSQCALPGCEVEEGSIPWVVGTQQQSKQSRAEQSRADRKFEVAFVESV